jgi:hypothetical protein
MCGIFRVRGHMEEEGVGEVNIKNDILRMGG